MDNRPGWNLIPLSSSWQIKDVLREICEECGIPEEYINASQLDGYIDGIDVDPKDEAYKTIEAISQIFLFDAASFGGKINFILRGNDTLEEIDELDLVEHDNSDTTSKERRDSITVPKILHLEYFDSEGGIDPFKQTSDRSLDGRAVSEVKITTPVVMRAADAAKAVIINHKVAIEEQNGDEEITLTDKYLHLTDADVISLNGRRLRIIESEIDYGTLKLKLRQDRKSSYFSSSVGIAAIIPPDPPTLLVGDTLIVFIDSHILRDNDDKLGYYLAISRVSGEWYGAQIELSTDGGSNFSAVDEVTAEAVIGRLSTEMPTFSRFCPDDVNVVDVELLLDDDELETVTLKETLNRSNLALIGNEIINFQNAEQIDVRKWRLSGFLRGRKGSPINSHPVGSQFVLLDRQSLYFVGADLFNLNKELIFRATSLGLEFGNVLTAAFKGICQTERKVANLEVVRKDGQIFINWVGVGRLGGGAVARHGVNFQKYVVRVNDDVFETVAQAFATPDPGGNVTIRVSQYNSMTGEGPTEQVIL